MNYIIFEDERYKNFLPITYTRFTGDMRVGILKLRQRIGVLLDFEPESIVIRAELAPLYSERHPKWQINSFPAGDYTFINARTKLWGDSGEGTLLTQIQGLSDKEKLLCGDDVMAFRYSSTTPFSLSTETLPTLLSELKASPHHVNDGLWRYTWEFVSENGKMIAHDWELVFYDEDNFVEIDPGVTAINPYNIWIGENASLGHGVILDATGGPIVIDENATLMHNAVIVGPAYIGKYSIIKIGAKIYPNTSIGRYCKIGGEVEDSIIQAYTNKQHDGFLGHSYVGEWVNIGADSNNSDLKNTYRPVKVWYYPDKAKKDTGNMFIGAFIADHTKIGINCSINTGAVIGFGANLYGKDLIVDFIPSFSWGEATHLTKYQIEKFLLTTTSVKLRRNLTLCKHEVRMISNLYKNISLYEG